MVKINLRNTAFLAYGLMISGFVFGLAETLYFGSNWLPMSKAELFCDYIATNICSGGMYLYIFCVVLRVKQHLKEIKRLKQSN